MALLFGSTWLVNSAVFLTALVLILAANLYVLRMPSARLGLHYVALLAFLAVAMLAPLDTFLSGGIVWRYVVPCVLSLGPMFFAGVIFARSFRDEPDPDQAFGSNIAGAVIGGLSYAEGFPERGDGLAVSSCASRAICANVRGRSRCVCDRAGYVREQPSRAASRPRAGRDRDDERLGGDGGRRRGDGPRPDGDARSPHASGTLPLDYSSKTDFQDCLV